MDWIGVAGMSLKLTIRLDDKRERIHIAGVIGPWRTRMCEQERWEWLACWRPGMVTRT